MTSSRRHLCGVCPALLAWALAAGPVAAQSPAIGGGIGSAGYGTISSGVFGATGYGSGGFGASRMYGGYSHLAGGSGGSGGLGLGSWNRYGRWSSQNARDLESILPRPYPEENVAHLRVIVPTRDAELWVNDNLMKKKGTNRNFISPFLTPGKHFLYDLKVRYRNREGQVVERLRTVTVRAGSQDIVDFTRPERTEITAER